MAAKFQDRSSDPDYSQNRWEMGVACHI